MLLRATLDPDRSRPIRAAPLSIGTDLQSSMSTNPRSYSGGPLNKPMIPFYIGIAVIQRSKNHSVKGKLFRDCASNACYRHSSTAPRPSPLSEGQYRHLPYHPIRHPRFQGQYHHHRRHPSHQNSIRLIRLANHPDSNPYPLPLSFHSPSFWT